MVYDLVFASEPGIFVQSDHWSLPPTSGLWEYSQWSMPASAVIVQFKVTSPLPAVVVTEGRAGATPISNVSEALALASSVTV